MLPRALAASARLVRCFLRLSAPLSTLSCLLTQRRPPGIAHKSCPASLTSLPHPAAPLPQHLPPQATRARDGQKRFLNVHEYISMGLMKEFGVPVPRGAVASTPEEAERIAAASLGGSSSADVVIKAQVLAGGRGLGTFSNGFHGGVHIVTRPGQARDLASKMLGQRLITKQTGSEGRVVDKVYLMERLYLRRETYFSIMLDRSANGPLVVVSPKGGTSIEDVAEETPEAILKMPVDQALGPSEAQLAKMAEFCGFSGRTATLYMECVAGRGAAAVGVARRGCWGARPSSPLLLLNSTFLPPHHAPSPPPPFSLSLPSFAQLHPRPVEDVQGL